MSQSKVVFIPVSYFYDDEEGNPSPVKAWISDGVTYGDEWVARAYSPQYESDVIDKLAELEVEGYLLKTQDEAREFVKQWQIEEV